MTLLIQYGLNCNPLKLECKHRLCASIRFFACSVIVDLVVFVVVLVVVVVVTGLKQNL